MGLETEDIMDMAIMDMLIMVIMESVMPIQSPMLTPLVRFTMVSQSITLMLLDIPIMSVSLLELTMVMDLLLAMVPLATEDTMDMPTMATMESVMLKLSLMLILSARSIMDFLYIMPMPLDTLTMLA